MKGARGVLRPPRLRKGGTIALVAPSSQREPADLLAAVEFYRKEGYRVVLGDNVRRLRRDGYFSAPLPDRLAELHAAFRDDSVDAVFAVRGGIGASWLLPRIDYDLVRSHPKVFMGYSDITAIHLAFRKECGLVGFHGPAGGIHARGDAEERKANVANLRRALKLLGDSGPWGRVENPPGARLLRTAHGGTAEGGLVGGNLSLVTELVGTPWDPDLAGALFFFEGVHMSSGGLDRSLVQLDLAGKLGNVAGVIAGEFTDRRKPEEEGDPSVEEVLVRWFEHVGKPGIEGLAIGHGRHKLLLPIGVRGRMDADTGRLSIEEPAVD